MEFKDIKNEDMEGRKMERLTKRDEFGNADIIGVDSMDLQQNLGFEEFNKVTDALNKLAEYEELEEQGKLLKLFVELGGMLYVPDRQMGRIEYFIIEKIEVCHDDIYAIAQSGNVFNEGRIGKNTFFTEEEAKGALKKGLQ